MARFLPGVSRRDLTDGYAVVHKIIRDSHCHGGFFCKFPDGGKKQHLTTKEQI